MTPNDIEVLLHCHTSPAIHTRGDAPAVKEAIRSLEANGLIERRDQEWYHTTARGQAHVEQLCSLGWPTLAWIGANGGVVAIND